MLCKKCKPIICIFKVITVYGYNLITFTVDFHSKFLRFFLLSLSIFNKILENTFTHPVDIKIAKQNYYLGFCYFGSSDTFYNHIVSIVSNKNN